MGLRQRIKNAQAEAVAQALREKTRRLAVIAGAVKRSTDGGLLVHTALEQAQGR